MLLVVFTLNTDLKELLKVVDSVVHLAIALVNVRNLLIAFGLLVSILNAVSHFKALFEKLQT